MADKRILMGVVGRPHGVRGLVRVANYASTPASLASHVLADERGRAWRIEWQGEGIARLRDAATGRAVADRNEAASLTNLRLFVARAALPPAAEDEYYLADLVGLDAFDESGRRLGRVAAVHDYGAGSSLEIAEAEGASRLVPFTRAAVPAVDLATGRLTIAELDEVEIHDEGGADAPERAA